jgi:hypothetical protein
MSISPISRAHQADQCIKQSNDFWLHTCDRENKYPSIEQSMRIGCVETRPDTTTSFKMYRSNADSSINNLAAAAVTITTIATTYRGSVFARYSMRRHHRYWQRWDLQAMSQARCCFGSIDESTTIDFVDRCSMRASIHWPIRSPFHPFLTPIPPTGQGVSILQDVSSQV